MGYKILDFARLDMPKTYLKSLPSPYLNFVVSTSIVVNDLSVFTKILLGYSHRDVKSSEEIHIYVTHQLVIFRVFGSKIYEACEYLESFVRKLRRSRALDATEIIEAIDQTLNTIRSSPEWEIAEKIRNDVAHYYQLKNIDAILESIDDNHKFMMLFAEHRGNQYHPIGEEIGYLSLFSRMA